MLSQALEIQANTSSRASLLAHSLEEQHPPSLSFWPPASVLQGKPLQKGIVGAEEFSGDSPGEMLETSCPVSPWEGLTCKAVLLCSVQLQHFLKIKICPSNPGAGLCSTATGYSSKHPLHICMVGFSEVPAYL